MNTSFNIELDTNKIHVWQYGKGAKLLIIFHGFSESGDKYELFSEGIEEEYTVMIPDLPFHGKSNWQQGLFTKSCLTELTEQLMSKSEVGNCTILGYSMGGRLAICLREEIPHKINAMFLIAPEGVQRNYWFGMATGSIIGRWLFKQTILHPNSIIRSSKIMVYFRLASSAKANYVEKLFKDTEWRKRILKTWLCFRTLHPKRRKELWENKNKAAQLIFGQYDRLIAVPKFLLNKGIKHVNVAIYPLGHSFFATQEGRNYIYQHLREQ